MEIEIWSDIACPWCYIGKRRFEAALEMFEHRDEVTVTWRSFELDPDAPLEREGERAAHLAAKYGVSVEEARAMEDRMAQAAAGDGIEMRFDRARGGNTFDAHRLVHLAAAHGRQDEAKERLFRAYFTDGELVSDPDTLVRLAAEIGLEESEVREVLASDRYADAVREEEQIAARMGIGGVPFFVVDRAVGASGAHPPEALLTLLEEGYQRRSPVAVATPDGLSGETCGPDGC
jgi:predicted DsbA family dithiol-disulfide isomerase